jgi:hypothetical protein
MAKVLNQLVPSFALALGASVDTDPAYSFYRDMVNKQVKKADMRAAATEYAWDMNWCATDAAAPLSFEELSSLGIHCFNEMPPESVLGRGRHAIVPPVAGARDVFLAPMSSPCYSAAA